MRSYADTDIAVAPASSLRTRRVALGGMLLLCAVLLGLVESWLVCFSPLPWFRIGLANIAVLVGLSVLGPRTAATVSTLRVLVVGMAVGTLMGPATLLSLSGAVCALGAMLLARAAGGRLSIIGWSVAGAAAHIAGQFIAAACVTGSPAVLHLMPLSLLLSLPLGILTGYLARVVVSRVMSAV